MAKKKTNLYEHYLGDLPSSKLMKMKWNPLKESEPIGDIEESKKLNLNEYDAKMLRRGRGLIDTKAEKDFIKAGSILAADLEEEGWDDQDITEFFVSFAWKVF